MGQAVSNFLLQVSEFAGTYSNPFKRGGKGVKFTKWRTIGTIAPHDVKAAKNLWKDSYNQRDSAKLERFRVTYKGKTLINPEGRVYEVTADGTHFVEGLV